MLPQLGYFDLVLTDPPYGINENSHRVASRGKLAKTTDYGEFDWDKRPVSQWLIDSIIEMSKYQVIWGGNYYTLKPSKSWLVWNKLNGDNDFADCELAWTNYNTAVRKIDHLWNGMIRKNKEVRFHPTQKPIEVISWCISLCPDVPKIILDPFMGSGTTLRAGKDRCIKCVGIDKEEKYCEIAAMRLQQEVLDLR